MPNRKLHNRFAESPQYPQIHVAEDLTPLGDIVVPTSYIFVGKKVLVLFAGQNRVKNSSEAAHF
ncbi:MAG: hypothetical protein ACYCQJ_10130 [Nitrososphaerales archaeon]